MNSSSAMGLVFTIGVSKAANGELLLPPLAGEDPMLFVKPS
jgi:hypothetical protein